MMRDFIKHTSVTVFNSKTAFQKYLSSFSILSRIVTAALKNGITTQETLDKFDFKRAIVSNKALEFKDGEFKRLFTHDILLEKVQSRL